MALKGLKASALRHGAIYTRRPGQCIERQTNRMRTTTATSKEGIKMFRNNTLCFSEHLFALVAPFFRRCTNGAVEVSFEGRTARMSAVFQIFTCIFVSVPIATFSRRPAPAAVSEGTALVIIWPLINGWTDGRTDK